MIIKSMSRKHRSFSQLYHYMKDGSSRSSEYDYFSHNVYARKDQDIINEFSVNSRKVKARKNGNYLFHEVIAITKSKQLTLDQEKERLFDIVRSYVDMRCKNNLVAGYLHDEKDNNVHFHLMISSNELDAFKNQRLTKFDFDKAKKELERYVIEQYPELEQDIIMNAKKYQKKSRDSNKAAEVKRKGGRLEKKEHMVKTLNSIFANSRSMDDYFKQLEQQNFEMYSRGNTIGFINKTDGKKYRLKTLALEEQFKQVDALLRPDDKTKQDSKAKQNNKADQQGYKEPENKQSSETDESTNQRSNNNQEAKGNSDSVKEKTVDQNKADINKARVDQQKTTDAKSKNKGFER
jgi:hypothetical protein